MLMVISELRRQTNMQLGGATACVRTLEAATSVFPNSHELVKRSKPPSTARSGSTKNYPYLDPLPRDIMSSPVP